MKVAWLHSRDRAGFPVLAAATTVGLQRLGRWLLPRTWDFEIEGFNPIEKGPLVVAANHFSHVDPAVAAFAVDRPIRFLALDQLFGKRMLFDAAMYFGGVIPLPRHRPPLGAMHTALAHLRAGGAVGVFPEGRRVSEWGEAPPKQGAAWLAMKTGAPLLAVAILGTDQVFGKHARRIRRAKVRVVIGPTFNPVDYSSRFQLTAAWLAWMHQQLGGAIGSPAQQGAVRYIWSTQMPTDTVPSLVRRNGIARPTRPAYRVWVGEDWKTTTWAEYAGQIRQAGKALMVLGVQPGQTVSILGFNSPEWVTMDHAAMAIGAVPAGIYTTSSPDEVAYILNHAASPVVLVENLSQWEKIKARRNQLPHLRSVVLINGTADDAVSWDQFMAKGASVEDGVFDARLDAIQLDDLGTLIYTSGTTGPPKGVMLSHRNLMWTASQAAAMFEVTEADSSLSYLPLSHIAEQMFSIHLPAVVGGVTYFAESIERMPENLKSAQPTLFFGVPRVWEKFHAGVSAKLAEAHGVKAKIAAFAMRVGSKVTALKNQGRRPSGLLAVQYRLADRAVFHKVRQAMGLGKARVLVSGAAPISRQVVDFFGSLDLQVLEVYGQSEGSGPTTFNQLKRSKPGSVGPAFPGTEVKIGDDGEVLLRGNNVFLGYYKDPAATSETLIDGWLHSGDLGAFDQDGFLTITGRKKDIIITSGGKNIAPSPIEGMLKDDPLISEVVVIGDRRNYLTCLVTLDPEATRQRMAGRGGVAHEDSEIKAAVERAVESINSKLARVEQIKRWVILPRELSMADGELTPTLKVKREVVAKHFADAIESMYV